jgi:hypothetical protein
LKFGCSTSRPFESYLKRYKKTKNKEEFNKPLQEKNGKISKVFDFLWIFFILMLEKQRKTLFSASPHRVACVHMEFKIKLSQIRIIQASWVYGPYIECKNFIFLEQFHFFLKNIKLYKTNYFEIRMHHFETIRLIFEPIHENKK